MKHLNTAKKAMLLTVFALTACSKDSGGGNSNQVAIPGVTQRSYGDSNQRCDVSANFYSCMQNGQSTGNINFSSLSDLCMRLKDESLNRGLSYWARQQIVNEQCMSVGGSNGICNNGLIYQNGMCVPNTTIPGGNTIAIPNAKNFQCRVVVRNGESVGDTGEMIVPAISGQAVNMYTYVVSQKKYLGGFFTLNRVSTSNRYGKLKMTYVAGNGTTADMIKLSAEKIDGEISSSVTGFAGAETRLDIAADEFSDATSVSVACKSIDTMSVGSTQGFTKYACKGTEKDGKNTNQIAVEYAYNDEVIGKNEELTKSTQLVTDGELSTGNGTTSFAQTSKYSLDAVVSTSANITTPTSISVSRVGYSLNLTCKPIK